MIDIMGHPIYDELMIAQRHIDRAVDILVREANPRKIILFGSISRNEMHEDSDIDLFVIEDHVDDQRREMVRLRKALRPLKIPVDIMVADQETVDQWGALPSTAMYWALKEGQVIHDAS